MTQAHPRECGADGARHSQYTDRYGSSPRVRGGQTRLKVHRHSAGLIPASAGRTIHPARCMCPNRAHPRECGADRMSHTEPSVSTGSSPRVRGGRFVIRDDCFTRGLIPASAGRTSESLCCWGVWWAHPRECGADWPTIRGLYRGRGSSPRVRGGPCSALSEISSIGLIPASAGRTTRRSTARAVKWAHPRECGADHPCRCPGDDDMGSSPRVRGGRRSALMRFITMGLIPASAGRTSHTYHLLSGAGAHPRECGADPSRPATLHQSKGLRSQLRRATY